MAPNTTQTLADAQQAHKDLQAKHGALKVTFEADQRKHGDVLRATEELRTEQGHIKVEIAEELGAAVRQIAEVDVITEEAVKFLGDVSGLADRHLAFISTLHAAIDNMRTVLDGMRAERVAHDEAMKAEDHRISVRRNDLAIYEQRLKDKIAAAGFEKEIKLL